MFCDMNPYDTLRSQEPSEGKFYQFTKKLVNKGCCFAGTICDTVDLWLATFFLIEKGFDEIRINLWLAWKDTPQKSFWYPQATSHVILWNCLIMWQKKRLLFSSNGWGLDLKRPALKPFGSLCWHVLVVELSQYS